MLGRAPLLAGCILSTTASDEVTAVGPVNLSCVAGPDAGDWVPLDERPVVIGRAIRTVTWRWPTPSCPDGMPASAATTGASLITDLSSANGVRIDGLSPICGRTATARLGGLIRLGGSVFRAGLDTEPTMLVTPDGAGHLLVARPARVAPLFDHPPPPPVGPTPERRHPTDSRCSPR